MGHAGVAGDFRGFAYRLRTAGCAHRVSFAPAELVSYSDLSRVGQRELSHPFGHRRNPLPLSAPLPSGPWVYAYSIRPPHDAPAGGRHEPQDDDAGHSEALWIPPRIDFRHPDFVSAHCLVLHYRRGHTGVAHRRAGVCPWVLPLAAIY